MVELHAACPSFFEHGGPVVFGCWCEDNLFFLCVAVK